MNVNKIALSLSLALSALPMTAMAEEAASNFSWNAAANSDYVFRGVTQTDHNNALSVGMDYAFNDSGFYVGFWGSNVKFGTDTALEYDTYFGWAKDIGESVNLNIMFDRYNYSGEDGGEWDFNELITKLTFMENYALTVAYSDNWANSDTSSLYTQLTGTWSLPNDFSLNAGVGQSGFDNDFAEDYTDYNLGISRQFGPVNAALNYYDTDIDGPRVSDRVVLTLKIGG